MAGPYVSSGEKNYVGVGKQSVKGTKVAPTIFLPYIGSVNLEHGMEGDDIREGGSGIYVARSTKTKDDPSGGSAAAWRPSNMGKLAAWFLGSDTVAGTNPYDHTAKPAEGNTWLSIEQNLADETIERFVDANVTKLTISGEGGGDLMAAIEWAALTKSWEVSATSETYETATPFKQDQATYTVDGGAATDVQKWSLELEWKVDDDLRLSKVTRSYMPKLTLTGRITLTQLMLATTDYRKVNYGTASGTEASKDFFSTGAFIVVYDNGLLTTNQRTATITLPNIDWRDAKYSELNPDGETVFVTRTGVIKKVSGSDFVSIVSKTADVAAYI